MSILTHSEIKESKMSFKSFAGIILVGIIGLAAMSGSDERPAKPEKSIEPAVQVYEFEEPIYITPAGRSDASLDH